MHRRRVEVLLACAGLMLTLPACGGGSEEGSSGNVEPRDTGVRDGGADDSATVDTAPPDPCAALTCPEHATCEVVSGASRCACDSGYVSWKDACARDADEDGLSEDEELEIAKELAPVVMFDTDEKLQARRTYFAVTPTTGGGRTVFYAHSYFEDGGATFGVSKHHGDSEFIVVTRTVGGEIALYLSAHFGASTDISGWYPLSKFEKTTMEGRSRPVVWVALRKHANYVDDATCETGAYSLDTCSRGALEMVPVLPDRNVGQSKKQLIDDVELDGNHDYYWTDLPFCGWRVSGGLTADRSECTPPQNSYGRQLRAWESGEL